MQHKSESNIIYFILLPGCMTETFLTMMHSKICKETLHSTTSYIDVIFKLCLERTAGLLFRQVGNFNATFGPNWLAETYLVSLAIELFSKILVRQLHIHAVFADKKDEQIFLFNNCNLYCQ